MRSDAVKRCASSKRQPAWIFKGACQNTQITGKGATISLGVYHHMSLAGAIGKTALSKVAGLTIVDATGGGDVRPYKGAAFPKYTTSGRTAILFVQAVLSTKAAVRVKGSPALKLALTNKTGVLQKTCGLAVLLSNSGTFTWTDLLYPVSLKASTLTVTLKKLPFALPSGALFFAFTCPSVSPSPSPTASPTPGPVVTTFPVNTASSAPIGITAGPDGNLWFTEYSGNNIAKITPTGGVTEYSLPVANTEPVDITSGPDGNLYFTGYGNACACIGRISTSGQIATFPVPQGSCQPYPTGITTGPDGDVWFTDGACSAVGKVDPSTGQVFRYGNIGYHPNEITSGPDGNLWFTDIPDWAEDGAIGRLTPSLVLTEWVLPSGDVNPGGISEGPDGNLWFTIYEAGVDNKGAIGRVTTSGTITVFPLKGQFPQGIVKGADGNLWFTEYGGIGKITTSGVATEYTVPVPSGAPYGSTWPYYLASGPDGNLWYTDEHTNLIGRFTP